MTSLDQRIRDHLDLYEEFRNRDGHDLAAAVRAVLKQFPDGSPAGAIAREAVAEALDIAEESTVAHHAVDAEDAAELLAALGLSPADGLGKGEAA